MMAKAKSTKRAERKAMDRSHTCVTYPCPHGANPGKGGGGSRSTAGGQVGTGSSTGSV